MSDIGRDKWRFVFWRGSSYLPYFETKGGKWFVPELTESKGDGPPERPDKMNTCSVATGHTIIGTNPSPCYQ